MKIKGFSFISVLGMLFCSTQTTIALQDNQAPKTQLNKGHTFEAHQVNTHNTHPKASHNTHPKANSGKRKNIKEFSALSASEQDDFAHNDYDVNIFNLHVMIKFDHPFAPKWEGGVVVARILQACTAKCGLSDLTCAPLKSCHSDNRQDPCTGVIIPADRQAFLDCFRQGATEYTTDTYHTFKWYILQYICNSSGCSDDSTREGCMLLFCDTPSSISSCLQEPGKTCQEFEKPWTIPGQYNLNVK